MRCRENNIRIKRNTVANNYMERGDRNSLLKCVKK